MKRPRRASSVASVPRPSVVRLLRAKPPPQKFVPPPIFIPPQYLYPPRLIGRFAKICTPFSPAQGNTTRTNPEYNLNTTAMVTHLKKAVIVVCFLTFETLLEAWATASVIRKPINHRVYLMQFKIGF